MISLTKLNGVPFILNCEMIETVQANPDTTINLTNGRIYIVRETPEEVVKKSVDFRQMIFNHLLAPSTMRVPELSDED